MVTLYGIKNCDTVKKARKWLERHEVAHRFHDFRANGLEAGQVARWVEELGWETVVNRRGPSWRQLDEATRTGMDAGSAVAAIMARPTLIKRPLLDTGNSRHVGFSERGYEDIFRR